MAMIEPYLPPPVNPAATFGAGLDMVSGLAARMQNTRLQQQQATEQSAMNVARMGLMKQEAQLRGLEVETKINEAYLQKQEKTKALEDYNKFMVEARVIDTKSPEARNQLLGLAARYGSAFNHPATAKGADDLVALMTATISTTETANKTLSDRQATVEGEKRKALQEVDVYKAKREADLQNPQVDVVQVSKLGINPYDASGALKSPQILAQEVSDKQNSKQSLIANMPEALGKIALAQSDKFDSHPEVRGYYAALTGFSKLSSLVGATSSAANDIATVFSFMKSLDSDSAVREKEYATAQNAAGVPDKIRNMYNKMLDGQFLNPDQRKEFLEAGRLAVTGQREVYLAVRERFSSKAKDFGLEPQLVVGDEPSIPALKESQPSSQVQSFDSKEAAASANLPNGTQIKYRLPNGQWKMATVKHLNE